MKSFRIDMTMPGILLWIGIPVLLQTAAYGQTLGVHLWPDRVPAAAADSAILRYTEGDRFRLFVRSNKPCYLRILYSDAEGKTLQLFPNARDTNDYIKEDRTYGLPTEFEVQAPFGDEEMILFASTEKFSDIRVRARTDGVFMVDDPAAIFLKRLRAMSIFGEFAEEHLRIRTAPKAGAVSRDSAGPDIVLKTPVGNDYGVTSDSVCSLGISILDSSGIGSAALNGTVLHPEPTSRSWTTTQSVKLHEGVNTITVTATDCAGNPSSRSITLNRTQYPLGSRWAVIVGVSAYRDTTIPQLKYAHRDATSFAEFLRSPNGGAFNDDHLLVLLNEQATRKNFMEALTTFLSKTKREDLVMIFFSGHGSALNREESYFLMNDTDLRNLAQTAVAMKEIQNAVTRSIPAERVIVFSDACFSGSVNTFFVGRRSTAVEKNLISRYLLELGRSKPGLLSITSSAEGELSREGWVYWEHGLFTYFLVAGLGGRITDTEGRVMKAVPADTNNDGIVTLGEITEYLRSSVSNLTGGKQNPQVSKTAFDKNLPLSVLR